MKEIVVFGLLAAEMVWGQTKPPTCVDFSGHWEGTCYTDEGRAAAHSPVASVIKQDISQNNCDEITISGRTYQFGKTDIKLVPTTKPEQTYTTSVDWDQGGRGLFYLRTSHARFFGTQNGLPVTGISEGSTEARWTMDSQNRLITRTRYGLKYYIEAARYADPGKAQYSLTYAFCKLVRK